jgi:EmrB/QacA subfamily drug resistance transporter
VTTTEEASIDTGVITDKRQQNLVLIAMCGALAAVIASVSGLNVAQQELARELGASQSALLWIINGYTLALAALLMPVGAIGDRWGRKPILLIGLVVFVGANLMGALSGSTGVLLAARLIAGVGAAMIMPVTLSVITSSFPFEQRARAVGIWSGFAGGGGILGLFVSAWVIDNATWPWVFALPIVLSVIAFVITIPVVPNSREHRVGKFDTVASILSVFAIGGLVLGIHEGPERGWTDIMTLGGLIIGGAALLGFIVWELSVADPLLDLRLFSHRALSTGSIVLLVAFAIIFGIFLVLVQFLQAVLGYSALKAATGLLPMMFTLMPLSAISPLIAKRIGVRTTMIIGTISFLIGLVLMALMTSPDNGYLGVLPGLMAIGIGMGMCMSPSTMSITESLPHDRQGVASALNDTVREVGGAVGIALLGSILASGYKSNISPTLEGLDPEAAELVGEGIGTAFNALPLLGPDADRVLAEVREAFVDGWQQSMWIAVGIAGVLLVYVIARGPRRGELAIDSSNSN